MGAITEDKEVRWAFFLCFVMFDGQFPFNSELEAMSPVLIEEGILLSRWGGGGCIEND